MRRTARDRHSPTLGVASQPWQAFDQRNARGRRRRRRSRRDRSGTCGIWTDPSPPPGSFRMRGTGSDRTPRPPESNMFMHRRRGCRRSVSHAFGSLDELRFRTAAVLRHRRFPQFLQIATGCGTTPVVAVGIQECDRHGNSFWHLAVRKRLLTFNGPVLRRDNPNEGREDRDLTDGIPSWPVFVFDHDVINRRRGRVRNDYPLIKRPSGSTPFET